MMRGGSRGRGGPSRGNGVRGGRGMMRGGGASGAVATDTLYEDVYEPAPQNFNAGYENGTSSTAGASSYFDEFPEPGSGGSGDAMSFQRSSQSKQSRLSHLGGGMSVGSMGIHQKAY